MGNAVVFAKAFKECGIGGKFSKFQIAQAHEWFELINVDNTEDSRFCFKTYDRLEHRQYRAVYGGEAFALHKNDPQWSSHLTMAQKVIAKIVSRDRNHGETRYYIDDNHQSVFLVNRMFVIEVTPIVRMEPNIGTDAVLDFLGMYMTHEITEDCSIQVYSKFGKVVVVCNNQQFNSLVTPQEFNMQYGEAV